MKITPLKMWVQNVLPVVYDDSLSYYEMVGKINEKTNEIINQVNENTDDIEALNYVIQELGDIDELKALLEEVETIVSDLYTTDTPAMDSESGSAGVADHAARSDHSHPSDSSKADTGLGIADAIVGQYVRIKAVDENGVPIEFENYMPHEIPGGGTTGQALKKESNADYIVEWEDVHEVPSGGTTGQVFKKNSNTNYDAGWSDSHEIPSGGSVNNILVKNSNSNYDVKWTDTPEQMSAVAMLNISNVAENNYAKGTYIIHTGKLYRTESTISLNTTLVPGNNISEKNALSREEFSDTGITGLYGIIRSGVAVLYGSINQTITLTAYSNTNIGTIVAGLRPGWTTGRTVWFARTTSGQAVPVGIIIYDSGIVSAYNIGAQDLQVESISGSSVYLL